MGKEITQRKGENRKDGGHEITFSIMSTTITFE